jgi:hypothetical protein
MAVYFTRPNHWSELVDKRARAAHWQWGWDLRAA